MKNSGSIANYQKKKNHIGGAKPIEKSIRPVSTRFNLKQKRRKNRITKPLTYKIASPALWKLFTFILAKQNLASVYLPIDSLKRRACPYQRYVKGNNLWGATGESSSSLSAAVGLTTPLQEEVGTASRY